MSYIQLSDFKENHVYFKSDINNNNMCNNHLTMDIIKKIIINKNIDIFSDSYNKEDKVHWNGWLEDQIIRIQSKRVRFSKNIVYNCNSQNE